MPLNNIGIIVMTLFTLIALGSIFSLFFTRIWIPVTESIGKYLATKISGKVWLYILEVIFLLGLIFFGVISLYYLFNQQSLKFMALLCVYTTFILIEVTVYHEFRKINNIGIAEGIVRWIAGRRIWTTYGANRLLLFVEQLGHSLFLIVSLYVSLLFMVMLKWEAHYYFVTLLFLPLYTNIWVYMTPRFRFNIYKIIFMRRLIVYLLIVVFSLYDSYIKFYQYYLQSKIALDFQYLFVYIAVVIYIAIDRLLKELVSDYERYRGNNNPLC